MAAIVGKVEPRERGGLPGLGDPSRLVWIVAALVLADLVLLPLAWLGLESLGGLGKSLTLNNYQQALADPAFRRSALNSLLMAALVGLGSVLLAAPLAFATSRTNLPLRTPIRIAIFGSLATPGFLLAMAWIVLASPNAGLLNQLWKGATGADRGIFNVFSMNGMVFVALMECLPFAFIVIASGLELVSSEMEDASSILGAGRWHTTTRITLPLVAPAILAGFILSSLEALVLFSSPSMIGIPANVYVLTTEIWLLFDFPVKVGLAAALALPLLTVSATLLILQRRLLGRRGYQTVTGKGGQRRMIELGWGRWPLFALGLLVVSCAILLPYSVLAALSVMKAWGLGLSLGNLTWDNFRLVFELNATRRAIFNSFLLATMAATAAALLAALVAFVAERRLVSGSRLLGFLAMAPMVVPGIVFAVGLYATYTRPPFMLYGTLWILFLAYLTKFLPFAYMNASVALKAIHGELEDAARILGASQIETFRSVTLRLMTPGVIAGWLIVFIFSTRELSSSILLFTTNTTVISVTYLDFYNTSGNWPALGALGVVLLIPTLVLVGVGSRLVGRNLLGGGE